MSDFTKTVDLEKGILTISDGNGKGITFNLAGAPLETKVALALDTAFKRFSSTIRNKGWDEAQAQAERFEKGDLGARRGDGTGKVPMVVQAIARISGVEEEVALAKWKGFSDDVKQQIRSDPAVRTTVEEIKREAALQSGKAGIDVSALFAQ